MTSVKALQK